MHEKQRQRHNDFLGIVAGLRLDSLHRRCDRLLRAESGRLRCQQLSFVTSCPAGPLPGAMKASKDVAGLVSSLLSYPKAKRTTGSSAKGAEAAMQRVLDRPETPATRAQALGVREEVEREAKKIAAAHKLEYLLQEETSRAVVQRVEQQLKVTGQLE